jgi:hypothetical protein
VAAEGFAVETKDTTWGDLRSSYRIASAVEAAMIGGTSAVITGGGTQGFVNGAQSGAMSRLFNFEAHGDAQEGQDRSCSGRPCGNRPEGRDLAEQLGVEYSYGTYAGELPLPEVLMLE